MICKKIIINFIKFLTLKQAHLLNKIIFSILLFFSFTAVSQNFSLKGKVLDNNSEPISFATILVFEEGAFAPITGAITSEEGEFFLENLTQNSLTITVTMIGYKEKSIAVTINDANQQLPNIVLEEEIETLDQVIVNAKKPTLQKKSGMLVFNIENTTLSAGNSINALTKTPGVLVLDETIKIKNSVATIYLNGKRLYLSASETFTFLQNFDAASIKQIEVITNPSSQFDAEAGAVLNIITTKAVLPGYKGSINTTYEQAIFAKYLIGTAHYFKNNWVNIYGSYSFSPRKENKDQDSFIRFFNEDEITTSSIWEGNLNRVTRSYAHQANLVTDFTLDEKNTINVTFNGLVSPNQTFNNHQNNFIFNAQRVLDSSFVTKSNVNTDVVNISTGIQYNRVFSDNGSQLSVGGNYIYYTKDQFQFLESNYFSPNNTPLNTISFNTDANQETKIYLLNTDFSTSLFAGDFTTGVKYSNINTTAALDFFDLINQDINLNNTLSDLFTYEESIFATYFEYQKLLNKWSLTLGTRAEYTDVNGVSRSLGQVNTQTYFNLFPSAAVDYQINDNNTLGINYTRRIARPRYESLNPFRYFINENNFNQGNPNLVPSIEDKITLSYSLKGTWFFELYYQTVDNSLELLNFQDNQSFTFQQLDANLINFNQYSFDIVYANSITNWWYASYVSSTYRLENEFFAEKSSQERATNSTYGVYLELYNQLTISQKQSLTADVSSRYISNLISGSLDYNNIFDFSVSLRKSFWKNAASINLGVNDIFNTNNVPVVSRYLNQDNSYFAMPETQRFFVSLKYNFGNYRLQDNNKTLNSSEGDRLQK